MSRLNRQLGRSDSARATSNKQNYFFFAFLAFFTVFFAAFFAFLAFFAMASSWVRVDVNVTRRARR